MRLPALARTSHKWLALILAIQAVFWTVSGLYMTAVHIDIIHGDHLVRPPSTAPIALDGLVEPTSLLPGGAYSVKLDRQVGRPVYVVDGVPGKMLFDATDGALLSPLDEAAARDRALSIYAGQGGLTKIELLDEVPGEIRGRPAPIWRVQFEGMWKPTLYISPQSGELVAKRHDLWRIFDFVWMFHIMDYEEREDVNNILLRVATWMAVVTSATGAWLLLYSFRRRRRVRKAPAKAAA